MMERAIDLYAQGEINGMLIFSAVWLAQKDLTRERWEELGLPVFLGRKYYKFLGEGMGRVLDAKTKKPIRHAIVTVNRLVDGKVLNTTRKLTDEQGEYRFGGWAGKDAGEPVYEIKVETDSYKPKAMRIKLRAGESRRFSDVLLRK
jgi:hypothetical protein